MKVIKNERVTPFDVDHCLIYPIDAERPFIMPEIDVFDPVTKRFIRMNFNTNMVRLLREERQRGSYTIVWSRSGWEWAKNVVLALGLEDCVDRVMSKPQVYFDDTPVELWLKDRVFIEADVAYKG